VLSYRLHGDEWKSPVSTGKEPGRCVAPAQIREDHVYDEAEIPDFTSAKLNMCDRLNIIVNQNLEFI